MNKVIDSASSPPLLSVLDLLQTVVPIPDLIRRIAPVPYCQPKLSKLTRTVNSWQDAVCSRKFTAVNHYGTARSPIPSQRWSTLDVFDWYRLGSGQHWPLPQIVILCNKIHGDCAHPKNCPNAHSFDVSVTRLTLSQHCRSPTSVDHHGIYFFQRCPRPSNEPRVSRKVHNAYDQTFQLQN